MSQVNDYKNRSQFQEGKPNQVLALAKRDETDILPFQYTTGEGKVEVGLALFFGTNVHTGKPNVIVMNPDEMKQLFKQPSAHILDGLVKLRAQQRAEAAPLPEGAPDAAPLEQAG